MIIEPVDCVVKAPVSLQIGDSIRPGVYVIDINFPNGQAVKIQEIQFKNYYTAFLTVRVLKMEDPGHDSTVKWVTALRDLQLMPNPHSEAGSQDYFAVHKHQHANTWVQVAADVWKCTVLSHPRDNKGRSTETGHTCKWDLFDNNKGKTVQGPKLGKQPRNKQLQTRRRVEIARS
ncbi:nicolin-1 isoform X2 [Denticeps clupeoides]|uniref:nicolin-1 isoform X2 n=1 Tax=Denticeps clupeoides TaxID=299321 RepID=UPI0010A2ED7B|nr:nicolin-1 isoform X2 [Denticeps clupeoides]